MPSLDQPAQWPPTLSPAGDLVRHLFRLGAVRRELSVVAHREITSHGFGALVAIRKRGTARVSDVAAELQVDLSVASRQIATLVEAGLVERRPDPADGRASVLQATNDGGDALSRAFKGMTATLDDALADWAPDEIRALASGIERLTESVQAAEARRAGVPAPTTSTRSLPTDQEAVA